MQPWNHNRLPKLEVSWLNNRRHDQGYGRGLPFVMSVLLAVYIHSCHWLSMLPSTSTMFRISHRPAQICIEVSKYKRQKYVWYHSRWLEEATTIDKDLPYFGLWPQQRTLFLACLEKLLGTVLVMPIQCKEITVRHPLESRMAKISIQSKRPNLVLLSSLK
jgi:hypothetical protein